MAEDGLSRRRTVMVVAVLMALAMLLLGARVPVLDEESYLDIAGQLLPGHPYTWWRAWQPWGGVRVPDAFVFAHPPLHLLWVWAVVRLVGPGASVWVQRLVSGAPWALLYGVSVAAVACRTSRRPLLGVLAWGTAPIVVLGVQRGLMPDLAVTALQTAAVALWLQGVDGPRRTQVLGGLLLAAAIWTKYPAALLVPVLLVHGRVRHGRWSTALAYTWPFWLAALLPVLAGEAWLASVYGRMHVVEVLSHAGEISRGDVRSRALGTLVRLSLGVLPVAVVVRGLRSNLVWGAGVATLAVLLAWAPGNLTLGLALEAGGLATVGAAAVIALLRLAWAPGADRGPGGHGDRLLLISWALVVVLGVVLVHNFAAPRYLLPAMAPMALVLCQAVELRPRARPLLLAGASLAAVLALALTRSEHAFFEGAEALAAQVARSPGAPGQFTGEWSFRWRFRQAGWSFYTGQGGSGGLVVAPVKFLSRSAAGCQGARRGLQHGTCRLAGGRKRVPHRPVRRHPGCAALRLVSRSPRAGHGLADSMSLHPTDPPAEGPLRPPHPKSQAEHRRHLLQAASGQRLWDGMRRPWATWSVLAVMVLIHLALGVRLYTNGRVDLVGIVTAERPDSLLIRAGGQFAKGISRGEWWRLVSCIFLHGDGVHIFLNGAAFLGLGRLCEALYGRARLLWLFLVCGVVGSTASYLGGHRLSVGASGAIFGMLAAPIVFGLRHRQELPAGLGDRLWRALLPWVGLNLMIGLMVPFIDNLAHVGGMVTGALLALVLGNRVVPGRQGSRTASWVMVAVFFAAVGWAAWGVMGKWT